MYEFLTYIFPVKIEYAVLFLTRVLALISTAPLFTGSGGFNRYKMALGVAITIVLMPAVKAPEWTGPSLGLAIIPFVAREFLVGALLGWIIACAFAGVRVAGELVTTEMGLNLSATLDPVSGTSSPVITTLYQTIAGLIFITLGAHEWIVAGLAHSFHKIPVGTFDFGPDPIAGLIQILTRFIEAGVALAAPIMIAMFVVTVLLGVVSRAVPQLNILDSGYALRVAAALGALALLLPALRIGLESLFELMRSALFEALPGIQ
ncbi:MAG: flagellar biosynthetic protein FliR [Planctomycetota bacterium]